MDSRDISVLNLFDIRLSESNKMTEPALTPWTGGSCIMAFASRLYEACENNRAVCDVSPMVTPVDSLSSQFWDQRT
jgi:hypothetical protein